MFFFRLLRCCRSRRSLKWTVHKYEPHIFTFTVNVHTDNAHTRYPLAVYFCLSCVCTFPLLSAPHLTTSFHQPPSKLTVSLPLTTSLSQHTHTHTLVFLIGSHVFVTLPLWHLTFSRSFPKCQLIIFTPCTIPLLSPPYLLLAVWKAFYVLLSQCFCVLGKGKAWEWTQSSLPSFFFRLRLQQAGWCEGGSGEHDRLIQGLPQWPYCRCADCLHYFSNLMHFATLALCYGC